MRSTPTRENVRFFSSLTKTLLRSKLAASPLAGGLTLALEEKLDMELIMKKVFIALLLVIVMIVLFLFYMGAFSKVSISEQIKGPYTFAYVEHIGPYHEVGEVMMELDNKMRKLGFNSTDGLGIYYDDPKKTPKDKLRSEVGSIITVDDMNKINNNRDKLNFKTIEKQRYLVTNFPIKNMMSYMLGPMKIYPAFGKYLKDNNIGVPAKGLELYDMNNKTIVFMMELDESE